MQGITILYNIIGIEANKTNKRPYSNAEGEMSSQAKQKGKKREMSRDL